MGSHARTAAVGRFRAGPPDRLCDAETVANDERTGPVPADSSGVVVLAATPIGDSRDASPRLVEELQAADVIAAEDTRRLQRLLDRLGVATTARVLSYFEGNEAARTGQLLAAARDGDRVLLVTDAGMPSVSDPGYRLVVAAIDAGVRVTAVPGPSAVLTALAVSGLPVDRFCFEGFLPRKSGERQRRLAELADEARTLIFFEAPHRTADMLTDLAAAFGGDRPAAVCRELTKRYEEVRRGGLAELAAWAADGIRGEVTVVVAGAAPGTADTVDAVAEVAELTAGGMRLRPAVAVVAERHGLSRNELYEAALDARRSAP